jgi:hypothetical protein
VNGDVNSSSFVICLLTESVADFELLSLGPGGVIGAGRPARRVADGVLRRRHRPGAAHEEQRGQGQRRFTRIHYSVAGLDQAAVKNEKRKM